MDLVSSIEQIITSTNLEQSSDSEQVKTQADKLEANDLKESTITNEMNYCL